MITSKIKFEIIHKTIGVTHGVVHQGMELDDRDEIVYNIVIIEYLNCLI